MKHAIIGAFVLTFCIFLIGGVGVWGIANNMRAVTSENTRRLKQGLPRSPLWIESLWRASPSLVLSGIYVILSVIFVFFLLDFSAFFLLKQKTGLESPYQLYEQSTPTEFWVGCALWLIPLVAALFIFVRSASRLLRSRSNSLDGHLK